MGTARRPAAAAAADRSSIGALRDGEAVSGAASGAAMITLREIGREDIAIINRWRRDPVVTDGIAAPRRFIGLEVDMRWYEEYLTRRSSEVRCAVCLADSGQLV